MYNAHNQSANSIVCCCWFRRNSVIKRKTQRTGPSEDTRTENCKSIIIPNSFIIIINALSVCLHQHYLCTTDNLNTVFLFTFFFRRQVALRICQSGNLNVLLFNYYIIIYYRAILKWFIVTKILHFDLKASNV